MIDVTGLGEDARAAVARASVEAEGLGLGAVGTEHLLLGVLLGDGAAARALAEAGATAAAARHKVAEASGGGRGTPATGPLPATPRAERAIGRAVRFSHQARAEAVGADHLLLGVLDVEGTAGQVLRGIGVDVGALRKALLSAPPGEATDPAPAPRASASPAVPRCGACGTEIGGLAFTTVSATNVEGRSGDVAVFSCPSCGVVLGVAPPRATP